MTATLTTPTVADAIATLRARWQADMDAAKAALLARGIESVEHVCLPPSDAELRADYWYSLGMLCSLDDLYDALDID